VTDLDLTLDTLRTARHLLVQLAEDIPTGILRDLDGWDRLHLSKDDPQRFLMLSMGEQRILHMLDAAYDIALELTGVDDEWRHRIGELLGLLASAATS